MTKSGVEIACFALAVAFLTIAEAAAAYDPLATESAARPEPLELVVRDADQGREIPIRVYVPALERGQAHLAARTSPNEPVPFQAPAALFSHGLGGMRSMCAYLGEHWASRGYVAVFLQHPGSDDSVWRAKRPLERMRALQGAANSENFLHRVHDVTAVLDQLAAWNDEAEHPLAGRLNMERVGMSGHSFGAVTTQAVSGQQLGGQAAFTDARIKAAILFSPSSPRRGSTEDAFGGVTIPWLLMTGTNDTARIGGQTVESRRAVYPALPAGGKYELVLDGAEHSAFTDRALPGERGERNPNHHRAILAISTAFWDAYLREDAEARAWLDGEAPRSVLEDEDLWQRK